MPQDAIASNPGLESAQVFVVDGGFARARVVQLGGVRQWNGSGAFRTVRRRNPCDKNLDKLYDGVAVRQ